LLLNVAKIGGSVGVKGAVRLSLTTDSPSTRLVKGAVFEVEGSKKSLEVANIRRQGMSYIACFEGVDTRNLADELRGSVLQVDVDLSENGNDEFYYVALVGLEVREIATNSVIGSVKSVVNYPAQDLLEVALSGSNKKNSVLIPFVKQIVCTVNLQEKYLEVDLPDGLLDEAY
jgi:16S rRNA processing protein RimM